MDRHLRTRLWPALCALLVFSAPARPWAEEPGDCPGRPTLEGPHASLLAQARELLEAGCRPAAHDLAGQLVVDARARFGSESLELAEALELLAETHYWLGERTAAATGYAEEAVSIRQRLPADAAALARSRAILGSLLAEQAGDEGAAGPSSRQARLARAFEQLDRALELRLQASGFESLGTADVLRRVAELVDEWGDEGIERALERDWIVGLLDRETGAAAGTAVPDTLRWIESLPAWPGGSSAAVGLRGDPALVLGLTATALARRLGDENPTHAEVVNYLGVQLNRRQLHRHALAVFDECLRLRLRVHPPGHPQIARAYHNRGEALMLEGRLVEARLDLETGYALRKAIAGDRFPGMVATSLRMLGKLLLFSGELEEAVGLFSEALPRIEHTYGAGHRRYAETLGNLAEAYAQLGELGQAERCYREALGKSSISDQGTAAVLGRLGRLRLARGDVAGAASHLRRARQLQESRPGVASEDYARTLRGLAEVAEARGELEEALLLYIRAAELLGPHPERVDLLLATARVEVDLGRGAAAGGTLDRLAALLPRLGESAYAARARFHFERARLRRRSAQPRAALSDAVRSAQLHARHLAPAARILPADRAVTYVRSHGESLDLALSLLASSAAPADTLAALWEALAIQREVVAEELRHRHRLSLAESRPELARRSEQLRRARQLLARAQVQVGLVETIHERKVLLRFADLRVRAAERDLAVELAKARGADDLPAASMSEVLQALPRGSALVAFVRFADAEAGSAERAAGASPPDGARYGAFLAAGGEEAIGFVDLGPAATLDAELDRWRSLVLRPGREEALRRVGGRLRGLVWEPLLAAGLESPRVLLVPDGALHRLSFAALPGSAAGRYLVEEGPELLRLTSEGDLVRQARATPRPVSLLALGGPDFDSPASPADRARLGGPGGGSSLRGPRDPCTRSGRLYFTPLPGARREAEEIAAIVRSAEASPQAVHEVTVVPPAQATEEAFVRAAARHSVLHVATHSFQDSECRGDGGARPDAAGRSGDRVGEGLIAGLAFAGANHYQGAPAAGNDGLLTVPEISSMDLSGVDWVVLSACQTASGTIVPRQGVLGLAWGFRVAGARSLILSLWVVEDEPTREWMRELYRARFAEDQETIRAIRSASVRVLEHRRRTGESTHPHYWAAFVATGGWS